MRAWTRRSSSRAGTTSWRWTRPTIRASRSSSRSTGAAPTSPSPMPSAPAASTLRARSPDPMSTPPPDEDSTPEPTDSGALADAQGAEASGRPRWWTYALVAIGIAVLAFAVGRFSTFGSAGIAPAPNAADVGFARDMQLHHTQAIEMAMEIYRKTDDEDLRRISYDIATTQAGQRGEMFDWLVQWGLPQTGGPLMEWMTDASAGHAGHGGAATTSAATDAELRAAMGMATDAEIAEL